MSLKVEFRPTARAEFDEAADRYETIRSGLGVHFTAEIDACVASAADHPKLYARVHKEVRRVTSLRFPYSVYFLAEKERIVVLSIFHGSRDPRIWQLRV